MLETPYTLPCGLSIPNRVLMAPMTTWSSNPDGTVSDDELRYLDRRAANLGAVMTAACYVMPEGMAFHGQWGCHDDDMLPSLRAVADTLHARGTRAILQIHHGGRMCPASLRGTQPVSASAVAALRPGADMPRALRDDEILATIDAFAAATRRAIAAGYDGVEIHGANTYLPQQFFSPHSNRRDDAWGGSLERRARFPLKLAEAVLAARADAPRPFAVGYRLSPEEIEEPGISLSDTALLVDRLCGLPLDWLHVSVRDYRKGSLRDNSVTERVTRHVIATVDRRLPVVGVGKLLTPADTEIAFDDGCDFVALGRVLLTDPDWMDKVLHGRADTLETALPAQNGDVLLDLPAPLYRMLLSVKGWLPVLS